MPLFANSRNPYKRVNPSQQSAWDRSKFLVMFVVSIIAAFGFFGHAASYHPKVQSAYETISNKMSITSMIDGRSRPCKIAIVSMCSSHNCDVFWERSKKNHQAYAAIHGYDYIAESASIVDPRKPQEWTVYKIMAKWLPHYDYVWYIDSASLIMNGDIAVEEQFLLNESPDKDLFISWEEAGLHGNSILMKSTARMMQVSQQLFDHYGKQQFFDGVGGAVDLFVKKKNLLSVRYFTFRKFQSYGNPHGYTSPLWQLDTQYQDGDFIVRDGQCGFSMSKCHGSDVYNIFWNKLVDGHPIVSTPAPKRIGDAKQCKPIAVDVASWSRTAATLLRREVSPDALFKSNELDD